jgi:hypothetical protein
MARRLTTMLLRLQISRDSRFDPWLGQFLPVQGYLLVSWECCGGRGGGREDGYAILQI